MIVQKCIQKILYIYCTCIGNALHYYVLRITTPQKLQAKKIMSYRFFFSFLCFVNSLSQLNCLFALSIFVKFLMKRWISCLESCLIAFERTIKFASSLRRADRSKRNTKNELLHKKIHFNFLNSLHGRTPRYLNENHGWFFKVIEILMLLKFVFV